MDNATDALKMAVAVLIFVLALSISINAFSEVRQTSQIILEYNDREYEYEYVEENKDTNGNILTERLVGMESIIPSIYKAYKENYKIVFDNPNNLPNRNIVLYKKRNAINGASIEWEEKNYIDLQNESLAGGEEQKRIFINAILYGRSFYDNDVEWNKVKDEFKTLGIDFTNSDGLYSIIKDQKYKESLGVYYQEEVDGENPVADSGTPDANKTKKRVITYSAI